MIYITVTDSTGIHVFSTNACNSALNPFRRSGSKYKLFSMDSKGSIWDVGSIWRNRHSWIKYLRLFSLPATHYIKKWTGSPLGIVRKYVWSFSIGWIPPSWQITSKSLFQSFQLPSKDDSVWSTVWSLIHKNGWLII